MSNTEIDLNSIAIIGMSGRFPGADNVEEFWKNIAQGINSIAELSEDDLIKAGVPKSQISHENYVKSASNLRDVSGFDADFFDFFPAEAELTDPQHRLLLECSYEAIEIAGYNPFEMESIVGVYAGIGLSNYLLANVTSNPDYVSRVNELQTLIGNDKSYACTRISHKLNLKGPCVAIDSACSTSLVAIHQACKSLLLFECDMALAGGARVMVPGKVGYQYQPGGILSKDGLCRPFDVNASGTVQGSGAGMVLLKRLEDAIDDRDTIYAVIKGSSVNNDGSQKVGYTAPSVKGQANVIAQAISVSGISPDTIDYVEAHGTATPLGDPIEMKALSLAFGNDINNDCAVGSLKGNCGHLDVAAGVAALIKTTQALKNKKIPPSINYTQANPKIDFSNSPFYVNTQLKPWQKTDSQRRAGISSFGIGGTNAHLILEEAPDIEKKLSEQLPYTTFCLSAKTASALKQVEQRLLDYMETTEESLSDIAYTLNTGRPGLPYRSAFVAANKKELIDELRKAQSIEPSEATENDSLITAFLFTGQGAQYVGMCKSLYEQHPVFRNTINEIDLYMRDYLPCSLLDLLWEQSVDNRINETFYTQPALFAIEYSLATLYESFGVSPSVVIGHSIGEIAGACFAGMFSLADGVKLICMRAKLMQKHGKASAMLAVLTDQDTVASILSENKTDITISTINSPNHVVVSGSEKEIESLSANLKKDAIANIKLAVSHGFHSKAMDDVKAPLQEAIKDIEFCKPRIKVISNVCPTISSDQQMTTDYWVRQMREPVQFKQGVEFANKQGINAFIEVGPSSTLCKLGKACLKSNDALWLASADRLKDGGKVLMSTLSKYYQRGGHINWKAFEQGLDRNKVALPTYPFQKKRYWSLPDTAMYLDEDREVDVTNKKAANENIEQCVTPNKKVKNNNDSALSTNQQLIADLWSELLGVNSINLDDDFFGLGGHSLLMVDMFDKIDKRFSVQLALSSLVNNPTLKAFSEVFESHLATNKTHQSGMKVISDFDNRYEPFPLVELQQAFLLGRQSDFGVGDVSTHLYFELTPQNFDLNRFTDALNKLIERHDMLRAVVCSDLEQRILPEVPSYKVKYYDFRKQSNQLELHLDNLREEMSHQVMPADKWPLFDIRVTQTSESDNIIHFSIDLLMLDIRSNQIVFHDLDKIYLGLEHELPKLGLNYRDYVIAKQKLKNGPAFEKAKDYWLNKVSKLPLAPDLPLKMNPADIKKPNFKRHLKYLSAETTALLQEKSLSMGVTTSVMLMTAYGLILSRWSKQSEFTLNVTMFDRMPVHQDVNHVVGDFTTVNLLSMDYSVNQAFDKMVHRVQTQLWKDAEHKIFDGIDVLRQLTQHYNGEQNITMPVVFTSAIPLNQEDNLDLNEDSLLAGFDDGFSISQTPQVWIDHVASKEVDKLVLSWDVLEELFPDGMIEDMFQSYIQLVTDIATNHSIVKSSRLELLPKYQEQCRQKVNQGTLYDNADAELTEMFLKVVAERPNDIAVIESSLSLTFAELYDYSAYWAQYLLDNKVKPNQLVAIVMEKGWQQIVAAYAIQFSGAAYVPVDANLPKHRQIQILEASDCSIALTQPNISLDWPKKIRKAVIDKQEGCFSNEGFYPKIRKAEDLAYVLFTSGSTGTPKGVVIDHQSSTNTLLDAQKRFNVTSKDRALALCSLNFDMSVFDIFALITLGGSVVIPKYEKSKDADYLTNLIDKHEVTLLNTVPAMVQILIDYHEVHSLPLNKSVRLIMMGGDFIPTNLPGKIWQLNPSVTLHSLGGPTETAIYSVEYPIKEVKPEWTSIPYGKPMRNRSCYIFDEQLNDKPDWVPGEIYIGRNEFIAKSYWKDEEKSKQQFINHPKTGERLFKTGDLGRYHPDGNIEILGRKDFQVKINGFRVELGEIEALLSKNIFINNCLVYVKQLSKNKKSLVAYIVINYEKNIKGLSFKELADEFKRKCSDCLPDYMVPHYFVELDSLPLSSNGKVDRNQLPEPEITRSHEHSHTKPETDLECALVEIWSELLEQEKVNIHDNFFQLGGHSLIAAQIVTRIRSKLNIDASIRLIFDKPTIAELALELSKAQFTSTEIPPLRKLKQNDNLPLSYAQQRLWFVDQYESRLEGYAKAYNMPLLWRMKGNLNVVALKQAIEAAVQKHSILRAVFIDNKGIPEQKIISSFDLPWSIVELNKYSDPSKEYDKQILEELSQPFDLSMSPLIRVILYKWSSNDHSILLNMHHIVTDAWSMAILSRDIRSAYNKIAQGLDFECREPHYNYSDYSAWQLDVWGKSLMQEHEDFWLKKMQNLPSPLNLFNKPDSKKELSYAANAISFTIDSRLSEKLTDFASSKEMTLFILLLSNFKMLLHLYTGENDIVVGTDTANRNINGIEDVLGYFINQVALRTNPAATIKVSDYLEQVKNTVLDAFQHEAMPLDRLVDKLQLPRDLSSTPIFQVKLNFHSVEDEALDFYQIDVESETCPHNTVHYDIVMTFKQEEHNIIGTLQYRHELYSEDLMKSFVDHYKNLLSQIVDDSPKTIADLNYLSRNDYMKLLANGRSIQQFKQQNTLDKRFQIQARKNPNAIALTGVDKELSYSQLDILSNKLACLLQAKGIVQGDHVAIYLDRDEQQLVTILAILKVGACYIPLDVDSPKERIEYILQDSSPVLLLTNAHAMQNNPIAFSQPSIDISELDDLKLAEQFTPVNYSVNAPAYIIYTSGTTGRPKGVVISHEKVGRLLDSSQGYYNFDENDVWPMFHSYVFDVSVWEMWGALCNGGRLVMVPYWLARSADKMWQLIITEGVTVLNQTPSAFKPLSHVAIESSLRETKLRYIIFAGEKLELSNLAPWFGKYGDAAPQIVNMYGITETTVHATLRPIVKADLDLGTSPIGLPLQDLDFYLLDKRLSPVPEGVAGEIYVAGPGVTSGYLNNGNLTADRIIPNPFQSSYSSMYRSGDLAVWSDTGEMEYIGRIDQQVKIRGYRVEMGEVENCLAEHPKVKQAVVRSDTDAQGHTILTAFWESYEFESIDSEQLRQWTRQHLPEYMVPTSLSELEKIPLTINGKVDRKALPDFKNINVLNTDTLPASTEIEHKLVSIFCELLSLNSVGINHNFFSIGGHSLLATQLISSIEYEFNIQLELKEVFEKPTIEELALEIDKLLLNNIASEVIVSDISEISDEKEEFIL